MVSVSLRQKMVAVHKFEIYTYWKYQISLFQIKKNPVVNPAKISFLFWKKCGFVHRKILDEKTKKNEVQKKFIFCARRLWRVLDVQYYCGILFWYNYWCPESLEYIRPLHSLSTAGRFFKKCQKFCQKMPKNRLWGILSEAKCCSAWVQQIFFYRK